MKKARAITLSSFIPKLTPRFTSPTHLAPMMEVVERIRRGEQVECGISVPPRHEKTETLKHAIALLLLERPSLRVGLVQYSQTAVEKRSREIRELYLRAGGKLHPDASSRRDWRTGDHDGGCWATSPGGPITGEGFDLIVVDDPVKDRATAESATERDKLWDWWTDTLSTRKEPGCSVIVDMTRWHVDDLAGRLIAAGMQWVTLPAVDAEGAALCPARYNVAALAKIKETLGEYGWSSLYQGTPFAKGGAVFKNTFFYDELPAGPMTIHIGVDFAYSTKARADYSVAVVMGSVGGVRYVLDVLRLQVEAPTFLGRLRGLQVANGDAPAVAYIGGQERGVLDTMKALSPDAVSIDARPATQDKFTRCQPVAAAWCAGKVLLPRSAPWLDAFVSEVVGFTGVGDRNDDQVDALAAAYDAEVDDGLPLWATPAGHAGVQACLADFGASFDLATFGQREKKAPDLVATTDFILGTTDARGNADKFATGERATWLRGKPAQFSPESTPAFKAAVEAYRSTHPD